jgi:copper(I)-binding protein
MFAGVLNMNHPPFIHRRKVLQAGLAMGASLCLPSARACEFFTTTLRVTHPWTRATPEGATSAIVCMRIDQVRKTDRLIGVETPVAEGAEMAGLGARPGVNLLLLQGQETILGETGLQLRLIGLKQPLMIATTHPMRLIFEQGGVLESELNIDYMPV